MWKIEGVFSDPWEFVIGLVDRYGPDVLDAFTKLGKVKFLDWELKVKRDEIEGRVEFEFPPLPVVFVRELRVCEEAGRRILLATEVKVPYPWKDDFGFYTFTFRLGEDSVSYPISALAVRIERYFKTAHTENPDRSAIRLGYGDYAEVWLEEVAHKWQKAFSEGFKEFFLTVYEIDRKLREEEEVVLRKGVETQREKSRPAVAGPARIRL